MLNQDCPKQKVLFILHLPPPVHGAATVGKYIKTSSLINSNFEAEYINLATATELEHIGKGSFKKIFTFLKLLGKIIKTLNKSSFDICYITLTSSGAGFYKDFLIVSILKLYGCKLIYHFHNKGIRIASNKKINRVLYNFVFKNAKVILLSKSLYSDISLYVKEENVFYLPNGISSSTNNFKTKVLDKSNCKILYLSNIMVEKGAYVLLDAIEILSKRAVSFEGHFVGGWTDITEKDFRQRISDHGIEKLIFIHGPKYGEDKAQFLLDADVFVLPTFYHYEAFPLSILEAMQYGLPVVSTKEGGIPDIIIEGETGFMVGQKNAIELADKLEILIKDQVQRKKMGEMGRKRYEEYFTLDKFEKKFIDIIETATK